MEKLDWDKVRLVSNTFISFIGAGILGLPYAFRKSGLFEGVVVMIIVSYLSVKGMLVFLECKHSIGNRKKLHSDLEGKAYNFKRTNNRFFPYQYSILKLTYLIILKYSETRLLTKTRL